jgi:uncharacterized membrane protein YidH (DUF202 family)
MLQGPVVVSSIAKTASRVIPTHRAAIISLPFHFTGKHSMNAGKLAGIVLIVAGVLALVYGGFSYTKSTQQLKLGPIELSVKEKETVNVPLWVGVGAIVIGGALLLIGGKKG